MMMHNENDFSHRQMASVVRAEKRRNLFGNFMILGAFDVVFWIMWWKTAPGTPPVPVIPTVAIAIILAEKFVELSDLSAESNGDDDWPKRDEFIPVHKDDDGKPEPGAR
jgi:hypothetical protein